jgi:Fe-S-cluster-containing dehydrogenase component
MVTDKEDLMKSERQVAMVFDLNKCIGCQTCSVACKVLWTREEGMDYQWWCTVNTQPGRGAPKDWEQMGGGYRDGVPVPGIIPTRQECGGGWDFNYDEVFYGGKGRSVFLQPVGEQPTWGPNWDEDQGGGEYPNAFFFYLPRLCNHCTRPVCVEACPRNAMYKRSEDGVVLRDETRCRGYRFCLEASTTSRRSASTASSASRASRKMWRRPVPANVPAAWCLWAISTTRRGQSTSSCESGK